MIRSISPRGPGRQGFTLIELLVVIAVIALCALLVIPGLISSKRASNERHASTSLKTLTSAEADFRANDRDWNRVNDFWTGDVKGLYTMTPAKVRGASGTPSDSPIRLIELSVAAADVEDALVPAGGENMPLGPFASPSPCSGYWFVALDADLSLQAGDPDRAYRADTGGPVVMGKCHHLSKFGFIALPSSLRKGRRIYIVNENNSLRQRLAPEGLWKSGASPPGVKGVPQEFRDYPDDNAFKMFWGTVC
jgi:prepilin-type N-terminal cleavage/methylation domain-containing protein